MEDSLNNSSKKASLQRPHYSLDFKYSSSSLYDDTEKHYTNKKPSSLSASTCSNLSRLSSSISSVVIDNTTPPYYFSSSSSSPTSLLDKHQTNESLRNLMISSTGQSTTTTTTSSSALSTPTTTSIPLSYSNSSNSSNSNKMHLYQSHKDSNGSSSRNSSSYSYDSENSSLLTTSTSSPIKRQTQQPLLQSEVNKLPIRRTDSSSGIPIQTVVDASAILKRPTIDNQKGTPSEYQFHPIMKSMSDSVSPSDIIAGHHYQQHGKYVKRIGAGGNETGKIFICKSVCCVLLVGFLLICLGLR